MRRVKVGIVARARLAAAVRVEAARAAEVLERSQEETGERLAAGVVRVDLVRAEVVRG